MEKGSMTVCFRGILIGLAVSMIGQAVASPLEGCPELSKLAANLRSLRDKDWREISGPRLLEIWPMDIEGTECEADGACAVVTNQERIIRDVLQCGEVFHFEITTDAAGKPKDHLHRITVRYSAPTRADVVSAAKAFATGVGLFAKDTET